MNDQKPSENRFDPQDILDMTPELEEKICRLIQSNRNAEAVELYCIKRDCGLEVADAGVREIASKHGLSVVKQKKIGCATIVLILVLAVTFVIWLTLYLAEEFHF